MQSFEVLRIALVVLWMVWAALAWWTAPRESTVERAAAALAADRVTTSMRVQDLDGPDFWAQPPRVTYGSTDNAPLLVWRTPDWRVHYAYGPPPGEGWYVTSGQAVPSEVGVLSLILLVFGLGVLVAGPPPVVGTRWHWFWIGFVPFGLGLLYWLARERPWVKEPAEPPRKRRDGFTGFLAQLALNIVASLLLIGLRGLLGDTVVPGPL